MTANVKIYDFLLPADNTWVVDPAMYIFYPYGRLLHAFPREYTFKITFAVTPLRVLSDDTE